jgi:hypothetical protein
MAYSKSTSKNVQRVAVMHANLCVNGCLRVSLNEQISDVPDVLAHVFNFARDADDDVRDKSLTMKRTETVCSGRH